MDNKWNSSFVILNAEETSAGEHAKGLMILFGNTVLWQDKEPAFSCASVVTEAKRCEDTVKSRIKETGFLISALQFLNNI